MLYIVANQDFLSAERRVLELARGLPRGRYEVGVACAPGGRLVEGLHDSGVTVIAVNTGARWNVDAVMALAKEIRRYGPDLVHCCGRIDAVGRWAALLAWVPGVVSEPDTVDFSARRGALGRLSAYVSDRRVDRYVVPSRSLAEGLSDRHPSVAARVSVISDGIDITRYDRGEGGGWRERLGVPRGDALIGSVGPLEPGAGFSDLIRAFASDTIADASLVIAGEGPEWEELRALARALGAGERVLFPGDVGDVAGLLADLDVFVLPSRAVTRSFVLLEAMAMACPVVASDVAVAVDMLDDGLEGLLVPAGDIAAMSAGISGLIRDPATARRLGRAARTKAEREFTVERMVRRTTMLYQELLIEKGLSTGNS